MKMADVSSKRETKRRAVAEGFVLLDAAVSEMIQENRIPKGNIFSAAEISGIMAAKRTDELIPLCHPLAIEKVGVDLEVMEDRVRIRSEVVSTGKTGVEMEALTAVAAAALTIYDMCKPVTQNITISGIRLLEKRGGKSDYETGGHCHK